MSDLVKMDELEQLKEIMEDEFEMLTSLFISDSAKLLNDITQAYKARDNEALRIAAHTLKGSSSNMCVASISDISKEIEDKAKANDMQGVDGLIEKLDTIHPQVCTILQSF
jgi:HPt (histidine-containing phosphotransfer) domain-containing protein